MMNLVWSGYFLMCACMFSYRALQFEGFERMVSAGFVCVALGVFRILEQIKEKDNERD